MHSTRSATGGWMCPGCRLQQGQLPSLGSGPYFASGPSVSPGPSTEEALWEYVLNGHRLILPEFSLMMVPTFSRSGLTEHMDT